jgi:staphylococcal nuclease domain-containing protein 1
MAKKYETLTRIDLGFIGSLYLNGQDVAELLIAEGLARLDEYASPSKALIEAEAIAKAPRKNVSCLLSTPLDGLALINCAFVSPLQIWKTFDAEIEAVASERVVETLSTKKEYVDVVVSDTRGDAETGFSFSVQILNAAGSTSCFSSSSRSFVS